MGDPKRLKSKYSGPRHPWQRARIDEERTLRYEYGLKNKKEIWKTTSKLKIFANQAKKLTANMKLTGAKGEQATKEAKQLLDSLARYGILPAGAKVDDVLSLSIKNILERRLQTLVVRRGLARSLKQARQFITHEHIKVNGKIVTIPSYLVPAADEAHITFIESSALANADHPERNVQQPATGQAKAETETAEATE